MIIEDSIEDFFNEVDINILLKSGKYIKIRAWIIRETEASYLLQGHEFKSKWLPKSHIIQIKDSERESMAGKSYAWLIEKWLLK